MTDPVAAVRKWLATPSPDTSKTEAFEREYIEALQHIHALLAEIDLRDTEIKWLHASIEVLDSIPGSYQRGYNDAIEAAMSVCAEKSSCAYPHIAALRKGDEQ